MDAGKFIHFFHQGFIFSCVDGNRVPFLLGKFWAQHLAEGVRPVPASPSPSPGHAASGGFPRFSNATTVF